MTLALKVTYRTRIRSSNVLTRHDSFCHFIFQTTIPYLKTCIFLRQMSGPCVSQPLVCLHTLYRQERRETHLVITLYSWFMVQGVCRYYVINSALTPTPPHPMHNQNNHSQSHVQQLILRAKIPSSDSFLRAIFSSSKQF